MHLLDRSPSRPEPAPLVALRSVLLVAYVAVALATWRRDGVPLERLQVLLWVGGALVIATTGRRGGGPLHIARDWLPIGLVLAAYDLSRGVADQLGMPVQKSSLVAVERFMWAGRVPTVVAQRHLGPYDGPVRWWEVVVSFTYLSHFVVPFAVLGVLWTVRRDQFRRYRNALLLLTAFGLLTYLLLPAAPPWLAARDGLIGPVQRTGLRGLDMFGLNTSGALLRYGAQFGNPVAALPSLHAGWSTLSALWFARSVRRRWWPVLFAYPLVMGVSLVISGEHFVIDVLLGYLYAGLSLLALFRLERWWEARRPAEVPPARPATAAGPAAPVARSVTRSDG